MPIVREALRRHRSEVDLFIVLSHLGFEGDKKLLKDVKGVDLVLGGHDHYESSEPFPVGRGFVIHPGAHGKSFAELCLVKGADNRVRIRSYLLRKIDGALPVDARVAGRIDEILRLYGGRENEPLMTLTERMDRHAIATYLAETLVNNHVADLALVDSKMVGRDWPAGPVTKRDVAAAFPVERQPSGTTGFSAIYVVDISAADAARIASFHTFRWPVAVKKSAKNFSGSVRLALPKNMVFYPEERPLPFTTIHMPVYVDEAWSLVAHSARSSKPPARAGPGTPEAPQTHGPSSKIRVASGDAF